MINAMNEKLLQQAIDLFDTPEKWEAFCELADQKVRIGQIWCDKVRDAIITRFSREQISNKHKFVLEKESWNILNLYLTKERETTKTLRIQVQLDDRVRTVVWIAPEVLNQNSVLERQYAINEIFQSIQFEINPHNWEILCSNFPKDIVTENGWNSCVYYWGHNVDEIANKMYNYYIKPMLSDEGVNLMLDIITNCTQINK